MGPASEAATMLPWESCETPLVLSAWCFQCSAPWTWRASMYFSKAISAWNSVYQRVECFQVWPTCHTSGYPCDPMWSWVPTLYLGAMNCASLVIPQNLSFSSPLLCLLRWAWRYVRPPGRDLALSTGLIIAGKSCLFG